MVDVQNPRPDELPSSAQLLRSTLIALAVAAALLVFVVLPAEYAIDPTGVGRLLGLTRMGEIKAQLAEESATDALADAAALDAAAAPAVDRPAGSATQDADPAETSAAWTHETNLTLAPDEAVELKLVMTAGARAEYEWIATGGALNYNVHGDGGGQSVEYGQGRAAPRGAGEIVAAFDGHHGCFWRNRSGGPVALTFKTRGDYSEVKRTR